MAHNIWQLQCSAPCHLSSWEHHRLQGGRELLYKLKAVAHPGVMFERSGNLFLRWSLVLVLAFWTMDAFGQTGISGQAIATVRGLPITVYTYHPLGCARPGFLFVFHGNGRGAASYRNSARPLADRVCFIVYAPLFDKSRFPNWSYHRGGIVQDGTVMPKEEWTVELAGELVDWARREEGRPDAPYYLFGHSAGGQFLSRVGAFAPPSDAERIVIANPSTQVLPSLDEVAPYGLGGVFDQKDGEAQLRKYLQLPITIYLGLEDTGDEDLTMNSAANRQGKNRLERGEFVFRMGESVARENGWEFGWRLVTVPGLGHSARDALRADQINEGLGLPALLTP